MNIQQALCDAFCDGITVSSVPAGLAVSTSFEDASGDRIGFYLTRHGAQWRIEDDGSLVPTLVATGVNVFKGTRAHLFKTLLTQGRIEFDEETSELRTPLLNDEDVPSAAMRFVALLIRVASLSTTHPDKVSANFRDDALSRINKDLGGSFEIKVDEPLNEALAEFDPDVLLLSTNKVPVAVFIASSDPRIYEALLMHVTAEKEKQAVKVVTLIDREGSKLTSKKLRQRARNHLVAAPEFYGAEGEAIARLAQEATPLN